MEFKDRIRTLRIEKGLTQTQLAGYLDKGESAVRMWEIARSKPDADTLIKLSKYFECSTDYLLGLSDIRSQLELESIKIKTGALDEGIQKLPNEMKENIVELFSLMITIFTKMSKDSMDYQTEIYTDFQKIFNIILENCIASAIDIEESILNKTGAELMLFRKDRELELSKSVNQLNSEIQNFIEKIRSEINKKIDEKYIEMEYDSTKTTAEQSDEMLYALIDAFKSDLHLDNHGLLDLFREMANRQVSNETSRI